MPTQNESPSDKDLSLSSIVSHLDGNVPKVICGVQRKINIGQFESIDVYCAASIPVMVDDITDLEELETKLTAAMEHLIYITSKETADKYNLIKGNT